MNIPEASFALLEELKRMGEEGVREIYHEEETLTQLEKKLLLDASLSEKF